VVLTLIRSLPLGQPRDHRLPDTFVAAAPVARDDPALRVDEDEVRLVVGAELPRALALRVDDRRPRPAELLDERATLLRRVGDVDPEVRDLGMTLLELCVGDRLASARASPRGPDVDEHGAPAEVCERELLAVERRALDRGSDTASLRRLGLGRRGSRWSRLLGGLAAATRADDGEEREHDDERTHEGHCSQATSWL
jgi:hypothetical protein